MRTLEEAVQYFNQTSNRVYQLHFSFGTSIMNDLAPTPEALLAYIDALMYASKKKKRS